MNSAFELVEELKKLHLDTVTGENQAACMIKRFGHKQKLDVYEAITYMSDSSRLREYLDIKRATHLDFSERHWKRQIVGLFGYTCE